MGKARKQQLNQILIGHLNAIHETFQLLDQKPASSLEKVSWNDVVQMGDQVSKQATTVGMLWTGEPPDAKALEENMASYVNVLQGFILLSHGSTVGAGTTLSSSVHASVKQVVDCSFKLLQGSVFLYEGSYDKDQRPSIPQLAGAVWEACSALKKAPTTNITAIGRAMTQVAVSVKDVIREIKELKPASSIPTDEASDDTSANAESELRDDENFSDDDLGNNLSPEEMKVAKLAIDVVSQTLAVLKELIRTITGLLKLEKCEDNGKFVESLEKLLKICQGIGAQIDELGACLYPPQEVLIMKAALEKISGSIDGLQLEVESFKSSTEHFAQACNSLRSFIELMESGLDCLCSTDLAAKMENVALSN